ncbi:MAG: hypothetical protein HYU29_06870 [Chloroflexi bacterium]|nr:hypothetical protein [Chloroflexota bacterium]
MKISSKPIRTYHKLSKQQLEIYAKELLEHYKDGQRLRHELMERNQQLARRVQELGALNKLFQGHLDRYFAMVESNLGVVEVLQSLAKESAEALGNPGSRSTPEATDAHADGAEEKSGKQRA